VNPRVGAGHARPVPAQTIASISNPEQSRYTEQRREFWDEFARHIERWQRVIAENRSWLGDFDPFGDFDLIFASRAST